MRPGELGLPVIDPITLGRLYRQHAPVLRLYARQWAESGEDLVQDAFVRLAQESPPPERILPWLYRVIRNLALAQYRGSSRRRLREIRSGQPVAWFAAVEEQLDGQEATRLLAELDLEMREVIVARVWGGLTFAEIADLVGCSLPTAQRRYQAALTELRERLEGRWMPTKQTPTI
jgi:RNA polymerase sigma-70 factor (ECF subfamily)